MMNAQYADNPHLIGALRGDAPGPTLFILCSIHGNEPAGTVAARRLFPELQQRRKFLQGEVVLLIGNTRALSRGTRYVETDLNRHWKAENLAAKGSGDKESPACSEDLEQAELLNLILPALARARGEVYFLDLHTASAQGAPFATLGDTLRNRAFAQHFPVTTLLGIEEQLEGTFLEFINNAGAITMGFEAGQHASTVAVDNAQSAIWIALVAAGCLQREEVPELDQCRSQLEQTGGGSRFVEIRYRHAIRPDDEFVMQPGFNNFQSVHQDQILAQDRNGLIRADETGLIIMPLYQALGNDGFFLGRQIHAFWLKVSYYCRRLRLGDFIHLFPGIKRLSPDTILVNTRVARIFPLQIFHLLGYRKLRWKSSSLEVQRRCYDRYAPEKLTFA